MENQEQPKKLPRLTKQDKIFVEKVVETGNQTLAAKIAYDIESSDYAGKKGSLKVRESKIQDAIMSIAERLPDELLERVHLEGLNASRTIKKGEGGDDIVEPDYAVRHKYLDTAYKLKRLYVDEEKPIAKENVYNFFFEPKFQQNIKNYDQYLKGQILNKDAEQNQTTKETVDSHE